MRTTFLLIIANFFLWVDLSEGVSAPVPSPWKACTQNKDDIFYFNFETSESIWDHPLDEMFKATVERCRREKVLRVCSVAGGRGDTGCAARRL